ncbi:MAG: sulfatase-like hydrolase/transferase [Gammaproteobacteria bacterium]|nr:sulfatase-like hydrolase/transferase [Gammaproteobacteria bacterium]
MDIEKPNVLFIITDQQRADHAGFMGNEIIRTPSLDQLAASGTVFDNAWVTNPVCMPNRSTILTGRVPTAHGVIFNDRSLDWNANTFARRFKDAGYQTGLIGKSHLQHGMSRNAMLPFRGEPVASSAFESGWDELEDFERYLDGSATDPDDFYGFEHIELAIDHGARVSGHHLLWALQQGAQREDLFVEYESDAPGTHRSDEWWQVYRPPYEDRFHSTNFVTQRTIDFIERSTGNGEPWLAWCSYPDPHHPMTPPGDWFFRHRPEDMPLPETRHDPLVGAPDHLRIFRDIHPRDQRNWVAPCGFGSDELLQQAIAATYGMVEMIDDGIGQVLGCVEQQGVRDNTIIVFTSDHGDMMGEHSLFLKGFMHYRGTLQVPLIIDVPDKPASRTSSLASSIDLGPTLLDLCGVEGYDGIQGISLAPILDDLAASVRDHVLIEDDVPAITAKLTPIPAKTRTLVTNEFRYTRNTKGEQQLFNLVDDPDEMSDLKDTEPSTRANLIEQLADALMAVDDSARGAPSQSQR